MRTTNATFIRVMKAKNRDKILLRYLKIHNGSTSTELCKLSNEPFSYVKNGIRRLLSEGLVRKEIEVNKNRIRFRWFIIA